MPLVTVIIPNYNNGRASSRDGTRDFLGDLLDNLQTTLAHDPTDLEIVIADDGSTDDSIDTARAWAARRWSDDSLRAGQPFLRLIELRHSGILSKVLNELHAQTSGEFICRLDGDILIDTPQWVAQCIAVLESDTRMGVMTGVQRLPDGRIHAFGDAILSPLGYHHIGQGARFEDLPDELEIEHAMGCFHISRREAIAAVGGYDEGVKRGQTEELAMRLNLAGWTARAIKRVSFRHFHVERHWRPNVADTGAGLAESLSRFHEKWGCDRLAPDLQAVWDRWQGTPLVQRAKLRAPHSWIPEETGDLPAGAEWLAFEHDPRLQANIAAELALLRLNDGPTAILGARSGLTALLRAREGVEVHAFEEHLPSIESARRFFARTQVKGRVPQCTFVESLCSTNAESGAFKIVALLDNLERTWNPIALLGEAKRLLASDGILIVRSRARATALESRGEALHECAAHELLQIVRHVGGFTPLSGPTTDGLGRLILVARLSSSAAHLVHFGA
jgi:glycosyltransferase involved in cell wall biosynthesis